LISLSTAGLSVFVAPTRVERYDSALRGTPLDHVGVRAFDRRGKVILADDVVAVEYGPGPVSADGHRHALRDAGSHHVPDS
jgi:hypothetical protein